MMSKIAIVTGGTRGIGEAISIALAKAGHHVAATYHGNDEKAATFRAATGIATYKFDVGDFAACELAVKKITEDMGPIDILVNNAGIIKDSFLHKMPAAYWTEVITTNLNSVFNMSRAVIEGMRERKYGRIISISSINGQAGQVGQTNYSAAKAAIVGFTKALALESASKGITVNAIAPGYIDTDMVRGVSDEVLQKIVARIPTGRLGKASEIGAVAAFLASDEAAFLNGATITANGGQYMSF
jgi:acetoacetyl-CoA reductase